MDFCELKLDVLGFQVEEEKEEEDGEERNWGKNRIRMESVESTLTVSHTFIYCRREIYKYTLVQY